MCFWILLHIWHWCRLTLKLLSMWQPHSIDVIFVAVLKQTSHHFNPFSLSCCPHVWFQQHDTQVPVSILNICDTCHQGVVTRALWPGRCHQGVVTRALSPGRCHQGVVTRALSPGRCHQGVVIRALSPGRCHQSVVTRVLSPGRCHQGVVTRVLSPGCCKAVLPFYLLFFSLSIEQLVSFSPMSLALWAFFVGTVLWFWIFHSNQLVS